MCMVVKICPIAIKAASSAEHSMEGSDKTDQLNRKKRSIISPAKGQYYFVGLLQAAEAMLALIGDADLPDNGELSGAAICDELRTIVAEINGKLR